MAATQACPARYSCGLGCINCKGPPARTVDLGPLLWDAARWWKQAEARAVRLLYGQQHAPRACENTKGYP
jgi:hypothetical protein